jgi:hypothetical protein
MPYRHWLERPLDHVRRLPNCCMQSFICGSIQGIVGTANWCQCQSPVRRFNVGVTRNWPSCDGHRRCCRLIFAQPTIRRYQRHRQLCCSERRRWYLRIGFPQPKVRKYASIRCSAIDSNLALSKQPLSTRRQVPWYPFTGMSLTEHIEFSSTLLRPQMILSRTQTLLVLWFLDLQPPDTWNNPCLL